MTQRRQVKFLKVKAVDPPLGVHRIVRRCFEDLQTESTRESPGPFAASTGRASAPTVRQPFYQLHQCIEHHSRDEQCNEANNHHQWDNE